MDQHGGAGRLVLTRRQIDDPASNRRTRGINGAMHGASRPTSGCRRSLAKKQQSQAASGLPDHVSRLATGRWKNWRRKVNTLKDCSEKLKETEETEVCVSNRRRYKSPLDRFRHAVARVQFMCRVQINLNRYATEAGRGAFAAGITDLVAKISKGRQVSYVQEKGLRKETITFNAGDYQTRNELHWPKKARLILDKNPGERTNDDIRKICSLMRGLHSFRKYGKVMQTLIAKVVRYQKYGRRRVVVRKGHQGYAFYFIFSGAACVTLDEDEETAFTKKEIVALKKGVCFGEIALIKNSPRMATVVCIEDTEFLVVDKDDFFNNGLHQHIQREFQYRLEFFKSLSVFSSLPVDIMESMSDIGKIEEYSHGSVVVRDSTDTQWLLFITKGRCDVLRLVDLAKLYADQIREKAEKVKRVTCEPSRSKLLRGDYPLSLLPQGQRSPFPWMIPTSLPVKSTTTEQHARVSDSDAGDAAAGKSPRRGEITPTTESVDDFLPAGLRQQLNDEYSKTRKKLPDARRDKFTERLTLGGGTITVSGVEAGVYLRIDSLGPGQCFGIESVVSGEMPKLSLLSLGCEVIRVPCSKLRECADEATLGMLQGIVPDYPDNRFLWESYRVQSTWGAFKQRALREVVENHAQAVTPHTFAESLRFGPRPGQRGTQREMVMRGTKEPVHLPKINPKTSLSPGEAITATGMGEAVPVISSSARPGTLQKRGAGIPRPKTAIGRRTRADSPTFPRVPVSQDLMSERHLMTPYSVPNRPQSVQYVSASRPPRPILSKRPATSVKKQRKRLVDLKI